MLTNEAGGLGWPGSDAALVRSGLTTPFRRVSAWRRIKQSPVTAAARNQRREYELAPRSSPQSRSRPGGPQCPQEVGTISYQPFIGEAGRVLACRHDNYSTRSPDGPGSHAALKPWFGG